MGCERSQKITVAFKENAILTDAFDTKLRSDIKKEIDESLLQMQNPKLKQFK
jgi:hypothetical protein